MAAANVSWLSPSYLGSILILKCSSKEKNTELCEQLASQHRLITLVVINFTIYFTLFIYSFNISHFQASDHILTI